MEESGNAYSHEQRHRNTGSRLYEDSDTLKELLSNRKFQLDCGHVVSFNHPFGNNVVIINGTEMEVVCTSCYD